MVARVRAVLADVGLVKEKQMFGALGFMVNGRLAVCVGSDDVMFKLGPERSTELVEEGIAKPVSMGNRTMRAWVFIDFKYLGRDADLERYLQESLKFSEH